MDLLILKKKTKNQSNDHAYHRSEKFTLSVKPLFNNNSLQKFSKQSESRQKLDSKVELLQASKESLQSSISKHKLLNEKVKSFTSEYFDYLKILQKFEEDQNFKIEAAKKIQNFYRNRKIQKFVDERIVGKARPRLEKSLKDLESHSYYCFWNIGKNASLCATKIQRWVRRVFSLEKIKRLVKVYHFFKEKGQEKAVKCLKTAFLCLLFKEKLRLEKWEKFKNEKLEAIKRNLAVFKIKSIVKQEKINLKLMKLKIRKYRRNSYFQSINKKKLRKLSYLSDVSETKKKPAEMIIIEEDSQSHATEIKNKFELFRLHELRKEKISMGFISHSVKRNKFKIFRTFRNGLQISPKKIENPVISLKIPSKSVSPTRKLKKWENVKPNVFKPTKSFLQYQRNESETPEVKNDIVRNFRFKFRGKVLLPTLSKKEKIRCKSNVQDYFEPKWNNSGRVKNEHVESLYISERNLKHQHLNSSTPSPGRPKVIKKEFIREDNKYFFPNTWNAD